MSRVAVRGYLAAFVWHAFEGLAREYGVDLTGRDPDGSTDTDERGGTS
jgi:hypothetical protein